MKLCATKPLQLTVLPSLDNWELLSEEDIKQAEKEARVFAPQ